MEFNPWKKEAQLTPIEKMDGKQNYTLESGVTITLSWNKFKAQSQSKEEKEREDKFGKENIVAPRLPGTVVYLPGWAVDSNDASIKQLSTTFAEENDTYAIATRSEQIKQKEE